ncbi:class I SAM-dependent methyltransferase [Gelatiniphilus marinus]|uniref:Class I SAM-dependent methyltransferase n=2 Tax=Gelatiniphilus marinus TaxID=1759464 RepID=A0ABW5JNV6_9FLAO
MQYAEKLMGLDFSAQVELDELGLSAENSESYMASDIRIKFILKSMPIKEQDAILDFGCGKGKMVYLFSKFKFKKADGVEISPRLCKIAKKNLKKLKAKKPKIFLCDASKFKALDSYTYFYFFNPFPNKIMLKVLNNIYGSLAKAPRQITILYFNPLCHKAFIEKGVFKLVKTKWGVNIYKNSLN